MYLLNSFKFLDVSFFFLNSVRFSTGELVPTPIPGGDEGTAAEVKRRFPSLSEGDIKQAIIEWRKATHS